MDGVTLTKPGGPMTRAELDALPEDGRRHELIDGTLVVTPAPGFGHQVVVTRLWALLDAACPEGLCVLVAPFDVALADDTVVEPDLLVAPVGAFTERDLPSAPLLAVEVLSPSTRLYDLNLKKARYAAAGCPSYWVVDPDRPSLTAWYLRGGEYVQVGHAAGTQPARPATPYDVTVVPADLLRP